MDHIKNKLSALSTVEQDQRRSTEPMETEVLYAIECRDHKALRSKRYLLRENPFETAAFHEGENTPPPMVVKVILDVDGIGAPADWQPMPGRGGPPPPPPYNSGYPPYGPPPPPFGSDGSNPDEFTPGSIDTHVDLGGFRASASNIRYIQIYSPHLLSLFRVLVWDYPGYNLNGTMLSLNWPFKMLAHYYDDLVTLRDRAPGPTPTVTSQAKYPPVTDIVIDEKTQSDLKVLLRVFEPIFVKEFLPEVLRHKQGVVTFRLLWLLFKPGMLTYGKVGGKHSGFVVEAGPELASKPPQPVQGSYHEINCWHLSYDGRYITAPQQRFTIWQFQGEVPINSLTVFPCQYLDSVDGGKAKDALVELGKKFYGIVKTAPAHMRYSGPTWTRNKVPTTSKPDSEYEGEIVIHYTKGKTGRRPERRGTRPANRPAIVSNDNYDSLSDSSGTELSGASDDEDEIKRDLPPLYIKAPSNSVRAINPQIQDHLTPAHYFLLPRQMSGFALLSKERMGFDVDNIKPMHWPDDNDPMSTLILSNSDKHVIKALARKYTRHQSAWGADFIKGKGEGLIFLLHGPPGTGKTYTVECVSTFTRRPLIRLTVADIGTDETEMESKLGKWFRRAADWGAIILIDEADVFLEKRQVKDLQRNSLVSVFLNCMEYYTGMLFLTTNRIGQMDEAFLSRTSLALTYETLDIAKQKQIWDGFLKKLSRERKNITVTDRAMKFIENIDKDESTRDVPWNGREIRNALQTAVALASFDAEREAEEAGVETNRITIRDEHFQMVVDRRKDFIAYRKSIWNLDEDQRANREGSRAMPKKG